MKGFTSMHLERTHTQWIFRYITKHHSTNGTKVLAMQEDLIREVERLLNTGVEGVTEEDRWMPEIDQDSLLSFSVENKQFWINAVTTAMKAAEHALKQSDWTTNSWYNKS